MAVIKKPVAFESSDGQEFATEEAAKAHDDLVETKRNYELQRDRLSRLLAETQLTADGERFELGYWGEYYVVLNRFDSMPCLWSVRCGYGTDFSLDGPESNDVAVVIKDDRGQREVHYRIAELYRHKANANAKLLEAMTEFVDGAKKQIKELRSSVQGG